ACNSCGSSVARSWPFLTGVLKSTNSSLTRPETCAPTWTVVTAESVPVAVTRALMCPRSARTVSNCGCAGRSGLQAYGAPPPPRVTAIKTSGNQRRRGVNRSCLVSQGGDACELIGAAHASDRDTLLLFCALLMRWLLVLRTNGSRDRYSALGARIDDHDRFSTEHPRRRIASATRHR